MATAGTSGETTAKPADAIRYAAFISYSHTDDEVANWLHRRLESYCIPKGTVAGRTARRIGKIFRDRAELASSHDLGGDIRRALDASDALILLCSPRSAKSPYVAEEIRRFKETGKGDRIFAAIVDGEPHAAGKPGRSPDDECFPRGLLYQVGADGAFTDQPEPLEPIAADIRTGKDGRENASLKIIAGLLGVGLDIMVQREKHAERARRLRANALAIVMLILALGAIVGGVIALQLQGVAEASKGEAEKQTASALSRLSTGIARESRAMFESEAGDHTRSLLMALYADPAARSAAIPAGLAPKDGYELARTRLVAAYDHNRLTDVIVVGPDAVTALAYSPDNRLLITGTTKGAISIWDVASRRLLRTLPSHTTPIDSLSFAKDGRLVVIGSSDGLPQIWDTATWQEARRLSGATEEGGDAIISPDGKHVVGVTRYMNFFGIRAWDAQTGEMLSNFGGFDSRVNHIAYSRDGRRLAVVGDKDGAVHVWDAETFKEIRQIPDASTYAVALSPDGQRLAGGDIEGMMRVWDVETGELKSAVRAHSEMIVEMAYSSDGKSLTTAASDGTTSVWDADVATFDPGGERVLRSLAEREQSVESLALSPDGRHIATGYLDGAVRVWDAGSTPDLSFMTVPVERHETIDAVSFAPDARTIAFVSPSETLKIWDTSERKVVQTLSREDESFQSAVFSADGRLLVTTSMYDAACIWDVASGKVLHVLSHGMSGVSAAAISHDGRLAATVGGDGKARIWDVSTGQVLQTLSLNVERAYAIAFSADDRTLATGDFAPDVRLWDVATGQLRQRLRGHRSAVSVLGYSPDGRYLMSASADKTAQIWDAGSGIALRRLYGHAGIIVSAQFSHDGRYIVTGSIDHTVKLWDARTGDALATLSGEQLLNPFVSFSPNRMQVVVGAVDRRDIPVWTLPKIITASAPDQLKAACEMLWRANAPLAFRRSDSATYAVLEGQALDPDHPEIMVSPCKDMLPPEAFDPATAKDAWTRVYAAPSESPPTP